MKQDAKIYVAGHRGLVGSALVRALESAGYTNIVHRTHDELDLRDSVATAEFFKKEKPEYVIDAAAKVGGINANNTYPAEFIYENLAIQNNLIHNAYLNGAKRFIFLGSACIYPKVCPQPIKEEYMMTGLLEPTNAPYAVAKIAGLTMCESYKREYGVDYFSVMPANLYGPNDAWDPQNSHVIPALIRKFHEAKINDTKEVTLWGTGTPTRDFLHVDDLAEACVFLLNHSSPEVAVNVGTGADVSIKELAETIRNIVGYDGKIVWDTSKPDGTPRRLLDVTRMSALGWTYRIKLEDGLRNTYEWYVKNVDNLR